MDALHQPTLRVVAIIAEGVPEKNAKTLIGYARANNKVIIGPATVGGVQVNYTPAVTTTRECSQPPLLLPAAPKACPATAVMPCNSAGSC